MTVADAPFDRVVIRGLTKVFGNTRALAGVDLELRGGEVASIEGPNGAGKSTLLSILSTLARPTSGSVRYGTLDLAKDLDVIRPAIGLVAHEALVYPDLTVTETLQLLARLYLLDRPKEAVSRAIELAHLGEFAHRAARTLSRGQLQRLALARAELHSPTLVLFDEPTTGLDVASVERVVTAIARSRELGRIVVIVTHDLPLAERVADRRVMLARGAVAEIRERKS